MGSITATATRKDLYNFISRINENCGPVTITNSRGKGAVLIGEDEWPPSRRRCTSTASLG